MSESRVEWAVFLNPIMRKDNKVSIQDGSSESNMAEFKIGCQSQNGVRSFEWIWGKILCKMSESRMAVFGFKMEEFKMVAIIKISENEWVWVRWIIMSQRVEWECFWVNLREDNKVLNPRWQCLNPTWQNSRWLQSSSWVRKNERSFLWKGWELILASVNEFERKN